MISLFKRKGPPIIMEAESHDLATMAALHNDAFARGWSDGEFANLLSDEHVFGLVARSENATIQQEAIGFILVRYVVDEAEILTIAVSHRSRGLGIGRALLDATLRKLHEMRIESLFLEVEQTNHAAVSLYRKTGFKKVGERANYYGKRPINPGEDLGTALVMRRDLR